ncbi:MAG TPA: response regulator, partial [Candidatus Corynebacterium intestinavium]|nr:response regulator [Candidatus Corynebacterium intestinavium]
MTTPNTQPVKVLVVDDEDNISDLIKVSLKFQGFDVETADNGQTALEIADTYRPDAFILDVMMPGMDGFTLLNKLREAGHDAPAL